MEAGDLICSEAVLLDMPAGVSKKHILLTCDDLEFLAKHVQSLDGRIELGQISWGRFSDGFPNILIQDVSTLQNAHVSFLASFHTPEVIFEQVSLLYMLATLGLPSLRIFLPYFPTGTMERVDDEGQVATASTLAQLLSGIAPAGPGPIPLYLWDIHALPIRHYFGPTISPRFKTGMSLLKERLKDQDIAIAFPDEGAWKRFHRLFELPDGTPLFPLITCRKIRLNGQRLITVSEGDPRGRDVVIIDDLIHSGETLIECRRALVAAGANRVSVYATHGVMEQEAWKKIIKAGFDRVWITDSCPTAEKVLGIQPFEVLSIASSITQIILEEDMV